MMCWTLRGSLSFEQLWTGSNLLSPWTRDFLRRQSFSNRRRGAAKTGEMGNNVTLNAIKGVHFLRNTCTNGLRDSSSGISPSTTAQQPPPSLLSRKSVVRKALRRPSKLPKKSGISGLSWDELGNVLLLNNKVRGKIRGGRRRCLWRVNV